MTLPSTYAVATDTHVRPRSQGPFRIRKFNVSKLKVLTNNPKYRPQHLLRSRFLYCLCNIPIDTAARLTAICLWLSAECLGVNPPSPTPIWQSLSQEVHQGLNKSRIFKRKRKRNSVVRVHYVMILLEAILQSFKVKRHLLYDRLRQDKEIDNVSRRIVDTLNGPKYRADRERIGKFAKRLLSPWFAGTTIEIPETPPPPGVSNLSSPLIGDSPTHIVTGDSQCIVTDSQATNSQAIDDRPATEDRRGSEIADSQATDSQA